MTCRPITKVGPYADVTEARSSNDENETVKFGVRIETFRDLDRRGFRSPIAQYYGIIQDGLTEAVHAFRGLKRPMNFDGDMHADGHVVVYSWRPEIDYVWRGTKHDGSPEPHDPPPSVVFVVLVRDELPNEFGITGSIEKWNWIEEDSTLSQAPIDWLNRYEKQLWSRRQ